MSPLRIYSPFPEGPAAVAGLTPRLDTLAGKRIGLLDNRKWNANKLLADIEVILRERYAVADVVKLAKVTFARPAPEKLLDEMARSCDAVVGAIGD